jgi:hypothetical protein
VKATHEQARLADRISDKIKPFLAGHPPEVQGAVLADMLAIFLAGHIGPGVDLLREQLISQHVATARELVANYDAERLHQASGN